MLSTWEGGYRCRVRARTFELVADEPPSAGGDDAGPVPTELFLASLASCFTMALAHVAAKRDITLLELRVRASGEYDGLRFSRVRVDVQLGSDGQDAAHLVERALAVCYVSNTLRQPVQLDIAVDDEIVVSRHSRSQPS